MWIALFVACATRYGEPVPGAEDREPPPRDDGGMAESPPSPPSTPPPSPDATAGRMGQEETKMAIARLDPIGGSGVTGMVSFVQAQRRTLDHDMFEPTRPGGGVPPDESDVGMPPDPGTPPGMSPAQPGTGMTEPGSGPPTAGMPPSHPDVGTPPGRTGTDPMGGSGPGMGEPTMPTDSGTEVKVTIDLRGATPGLHGLVIHERGDCGNEGRNAGGHFNPMSRPHGDVSAAEHHPGDLGNIVVGTDGNGHKELTLTAVTLGEGPNSIAGLAVIVHDSRDDFTQPMGNIGKPLACGVIAEQMAGK